MQGGDIIGEKLCITQGFQSSLVDSANGHDYAVTSVTLWDSTESIEREVTGKVFVVAMDCEENRNEDWNHNQDDPCAFAKLGDGEHHHDDRSANGAKTVDQHLMSPAFVIAQDRT